MHLPLRYHIDQPRNPNHEQDFVYVTRHNKWVLNSIGIWPSALKGIGKYLPNIAIVISSALLSFMVLQCILHLLFEQKDKLLRLKILGLSAFSLISIVKYWALAIRKYEIKRCIEQVRTDWEQVELSEDRDLMLRYGRMGRNLSVCSIAFMYAGGIIYHTIQQYRLGSYVDENNRTIKLLIYPTYSRLLDVQKSPVYEVVYVVQCVCGYVFDTVPAGVCGLAALFATHACGQIDVVMARLDDLVAGRLASDASSPRKRLIEIVRHHTKVLRSVLSTSRFSATVETVLSEVCFFEFVGTTFVICLLEYYCITDWRQNEMISLITYSTLLISLTFNIFLLCYISDLLIEKSTNVGIFCCTIDWYELPTSTIQGLILVIAISAYPAKFTAGGIADLSLSTFANILKTTFAYLNFLQTATV